MPKSKGNVDPKNLLRVEAEKIVQENPNQLPRDMDALSPELLAKTLHELSVHQVELEMQNEELRRAQDELRESQERFFDLYDLAPVGYLTLNKDGKILESNLTAASMFGLVRGELVNKYLSRFIIRSDQDIYYLLQKRLLYSGDPQSCDLRMEKNDGVQIWVHLSATPSNYLEEFDALRVTLTDITELKRSMEDLKTSEVKYRSLFETLQEGFSLHELVYSKDGKVIDYRILNVNPAFEKILGIKASQAIGCLATKLYGVTQAPYLEEYARVAQTSHTTIFETFFPPLNKYFRIVAFCPSVGQVATLFEDITERKLADEKLLQDKVELKRLFDQEERSRLSLNELAEGLKKSNKEVLLLNQTLEERVADRTAKLQTSNQELESFAYSVSHDLRAPLRAIDGFTRILEQDYAQSFDEEGLRLLKIVRDNTTIMDSLIRDLLEYSRVGRIELKLSHINMKEMVQNTFSELATPGVLEKITLNVSDLPDVFGAPDQIHRVWNNLISNAIKYTMPKEKGQIETNGSVKNGMVTYSIKDNGVGFNPEFKEKLFTLFQRLHQPDEFEGAGVGLAIVKRIIFRHGGKVWADGQINEGATFYFSIPEKLTGNDGS